MAPSDSKSLSNIAKALSQSRLNKDSLVKLLRQAEGALLKLGQSESLQSEIEPLSDALVQHNLLHHNDKDVRLLVAACFCEIIRVLAPNPPYNDKTLKDIFDLMIGMFAELSDIASPYFTRRVKILETVAALKCCVLMLDICDHLVVKMFKVFFSVVREDHQQSLYQSMVSIMTNILEEMLSQPLLEEKVSQPLLDVILRNLLKKEKHDPPSSYRLAVSVLQNCAEKLGPLVQSFLISSIEEKDSEGSELKAFYHDIIFEIFKCAPQMLLAVIPNLTQELLTDQVDVRIKAVNLLGRLFSVPGHHVANEYRQLFVEFLKRFSDKSVEVRLGAVECAKTCYMVNPSGTEAIEVLTALEGRLLDFDDKVRTKAVDAVCDLAKSYPISIRSELILQAMERLRDKKVSVRKNAMQKLLELYRSYCTKCSEGSLTHIDHFEQIPSRILALCFDKDCKEFRPQSMELVLAEDLFPATLTVEERARHWTSSFTFFTSAHMKALNSILSQKRRLQMEMQVYLTLRVKEKENDSEEVKKRILGSFKRMSASFIDPSKAEECFQKLHQMRDTSMFKAFLQLLDGGTTTVTAQTIRKAFLERVGKKHPNYDFLRLLSAKCSYTLFNAEHVQCILLDVLSEQTARKKNLQTASIDLLLTVVSMFPLLLRGSEECFLMLFSRESRPFNDKLLRTLAVVGPHISLKLSDIYPSLERVCMEGTRIQAKFSVAAIAALAGASNQSVFSDLYNKLVDSLQNGRNIPTVLQSLGCIAQHSVPTYESREEEVTQFIINKIFYSTNLSIGRNSFNDESFFSNCCKLKIYGLKALVRSFLPFQTTHVKLQIERLVNTLLELIREDDISDDTKLSENDSAHVRLAVAKSFLRLARRWDSYISPPVFHLVILMARDPSSLVRRSFLEKIHKLLRERSIPSRYACAFALASSDCIGDSTKYLAEFIKDYGQEARICQNREVQVPGRTMTSCPEYVVVFLIHVLAHHPDFPSESQDEDSYARFCSPLLVFLEAIAGPSCVDSNKNDVNETASFLLSILRAIKLAEDAVDSCGTSKLHVLSDIGALIIKALNHTQVSSPHTSGLVLLPSSFYKASYKTKNEKSSSSILTKCSIDKSFIERVHYMINWQIAQPTSPDTKQGRKLQEDSMHLDVRYNTRKLSLRKQTDPLMDKTKGDYSSAPGKELKRTTKQQQSTGEMNEAVLSSTACMSVELQQVSTVCEGRNESPQNAEPNLLREHLLSSCGSVVTKPALSDSQASNKGKELVNWIDLDKDMTSTNSRISIKICRMSEGNHELHSKNAKSGKEFKYGCESLLGRRIKLWSLVDKCFYSGTVDEFDSQNSTHKVIYDGGEVEWLCLANEKWEVISNTSLTEKVATNFHLTDWKCQEERLLDASDQLKFVQPESSAYCDPGMETSFTGLKEVISISDDKDETGSGNLHREIVYSAADATKKRKKNTAHPLHIKRMRQTSKVIDEAATAEVRRSRRLKVLSNH
ncbi:hypothetical protein AAC387_Pa07g2909 [Persea americana]